MLYFTAVLDGQVNISSDRSIIASAIDSGYRNRSIDGDGCPCGKLDRLFKRIYEDNANGKLSDSRFQMLSDDYEQEQEELRKKLLRLNEEITKQEEQSENIDRFISKVRKYLDLDELTPAVLNDMVKAVYVHAPDKSKGHREQQIDISYDLVGILPASLLNDLQNGETA